MHNHPIATTISGLYKVYLPRISKRTILGRPKDYNVPPVTELGGKLDDRTTSTDVSIITTASSSPVATKAAMAPTNISTTRVTISTTSIPSKNIRHTRNLRFKSRRITRAKI